LSASASEIDWWEEHRPDIFSFVSEGQIWVSPETGEQLVSCPWLQKLPNQQKYACSIYDDRPNDCRYYPVDIAQMIRDECEMLDAGDLRHYEKAQRTLDDLMADSRPPVSKERR
jgi:Fe-S-cluster containining protein